MAKFIRVRALNSKDEIIVQLNTDHIVVMKPKGSDFTARMIMKDVLGNKYISLETPDDFRAKIGAEE